MRGPSDAVLCSVLSRLSIFIMQFWVGHCDRRTAESSQSCSAWRLCAGGARVFSPSSGACTRAGREIVGKFCGTAVSCVQTCMHAEAARVAAAIHMRRATPPPGRPILLSRSTIHHFFPRVFPVYDGHIASLPEHEPRFHVWRSPSSFISAAQLGADALSSLPLLSFLRTLSPTANRRLVLNTDAAAPVLVSVGRFVVLFDRCLLGAALVPLLTCMVLQ